MITVVCHKEHSKMIQNIRFYNCCFKFGCGNIVDENMICSCCSFLSNVCRFVYDWDHAMAIHDINNILYFVILFKIKLAHIEIASQPLLPPFLRCHLLVVFYLSVLQIIFRQDLVAYLVSNLEICFSNFNLLFLDITIKWHHNLLTSLF